MEDYRKGRLREKYMNDAVFNKVVDNMYAVILNHGITPSELREAVFLAHYKYETENPEAINRRLNVNMAEIYNR